MLPVDTLDPQQWAQFLFGRAALGDARRTRRAVALAASLASHPGTSPAQACSANSAALEAANRFLRNPSISASDLLESGFLSTSELVENCSLDEQILAIQDTTAIGYDHSVRDQLGDLGGPAKSTSRGWFVHSTLLWSLQGAGPLGLIAQEWMLRPPAQRGKKHQRGKRAYEVKESFKWQTAHQHMQQRLGPQARSRIITVCDSEADIYLLLNYFTTHSARFVVRTTWDRRLSGSASYPSPHLHPHLQAQTVRGRRTVAIPQRQGRTARTAQLEIRSAVVTLKRPKPLPAKSAPGQLPVHVVFAKEANPPSGIDGLEWMLLTSEPIGTEEEINRVLDIYQKRWKIEEFHKSWKSGTRVEELRQQSAENLQKAAVMLSFVAVRLLQLKMQMEAAPEQSCERVLLPREWKMLWATSEKKELPKQIPTMKWAYRALARLGHWSDTKRTGIASWEALWTGWQRLTDALLGYLAAQRLLEGKM